MDTEISWQHQDQARHLLSHRFKQFSLLAEVRRNDEGQEKERALQRFAYRPKELVPRLDLHPASPDRKKVDVNRCWDM